MGIERLIVFLSFNYFNDGVALYKVDMLFTPEVKLSDSDNLGAVKFRISEELNGEKKNGEPKIKGERGIE